MRISTMLGGENRRRRLLWLKAQLNVLTVEAQLCILQRISMREAAWVRTTCPISAAGSPRRNLTLLSARIVVWLNSLCRWMLVQELRHRVIGRSLRIPNACSALLRFYNSSQGECVMRRFGKCLIRQLPSRFRINAMQHIQ
jgi:hypothetical protein